MPPLSVGTIAGGTCVNVVRDRCEVTVDRRLLPGEGFDEAEANLHRFLRHGLGEGFEYDCQVLLRDPPLDSGPNRFLALRLAEAASQASVDAALVGLPYCTNASKYAASGIRSVVFDPGEPARAHAATEWVALSSLYSAGGVYRAFIVRRP